MENIATNSIYNKNNSEITRHTIRVNTYAQSFLNDLQKAQMESQRNHSIIKSTFCHPNVENKILKCQMEQKLWKHNPRLDNVPDIGNHQEIPIGNQNWDQN